MRGQPRFSLLSAPNRHVFNYDKNYDAAWVDPNGELMAAVQKRGAAIISRE